MLASTFLGAGCISLTTPRPTKQEQARLDALVQQNLSPSPDRPIESVPQGRFTLPLQERVFGKFFVNCRLNGRSTDLMMDWGAGTTLGLTPRTTLDVKARLSDKWESSSWIDSASETGWAWWTKWSRRELPAAQRAVRHGADQH